METLSYFYHPDHLGSTSWVTDSAKNGVQYCEYLPYGEPLVDQRSTTWNSRYTFSGKERDSETGYSYFGARYYHPDLSIWLSVDPLSDKYPNLTPYAYCANNPVMYIDPDGRDWVDADGNKIKDHSEIKVYIFYDPESFDSQSKQMYRDAVAKYGEGSVAMSNVTTEKEFIQDWGDMASGDIKEVNLNYHGNNQTLMLNSKAGQYITATGNGTTTNSDLQDNTNVQNLPMPIGNTGNAQLNINSCRSNSRTQHPLKGSGQTLMEAFYKSTNFKIVRGTSYGVSYDRRTQQPFPGHSWWRGTWDYMRRPTQVPKRYPGIGLPPK